MDSLMDLIDSLPKEIPDFVSDYFVVVLCIIYVLFKLRKGKKKTANGTHQGKATDSFQQSNRQLSRQYRPQSGQQGNRQVSQQYRQQVAQSYNRQGMAARPQNMAARPQNMPQRTPTPARFGEPSAMPHTHRPSGVYDTFNRRSARNDSGTMPHKHEEGHYTSMMDVSKLPKGYILLNGEPVRVADLEDK